MDERYTELFDLFWENSKFSEATIGEFQKRVEEYSGVEHEVAALQYSSPDVVLPKPKDKLIGIMKQRHSVRVFSNKDVSVKQLGSLLSAFTSNGETKVYPSAGATYPLEIFCITNGIKGEVNGKICYYNYDNHSISLIGDAPSWEDYAALLNVDTENTIPALVFFFVLFPDRIVSKYGERGGRFALIEVGHAAQNLALRLTEEKMAGVETGGLLDDKIKKLLKLDKTNALIALGFACGFSKPQPK
ncbi:MAG: hypothetical protein NVS1B7_6360 [Candidatus Saccharimonadales bacterium]